MRRRQETSAAIMIGDRYFYAIRKGRVLTAHSLAGAKLYGLHPAYYAHRRNWEDDLDRLEQRGKKPTLVYIGHIDGTDLVSARLP